MLIHCYQNLIIILICLYLSREFKIAPIFVDSFLLPLYIVSYVFCMLFYEDV